MARFLPADAREGSVVAEGDSLTHSLALIVTHAPTPVRRHQPPNGRPPGAVRSGMHLLLRYTQALITQMAQTAVRNRHHSVDQQLCRGCC